MIPEFWLAASNSLARHARKATIVCKGSSDEDDINTLINDLKSRGSQSTWAEGGGIGFYPGNYITDGPILLGAMTGVALSGPTRGGNPGAVQIKLADNSNCNMITIQRDGGADIATWFTCENISLNGNGANQTSGHGLYVNYGAGITLANVEIRGMKQDGLHVTAPNPVYSHSVNCYSSHFSSNLGNGVYTARAGAMWLTDCYLEDNTGYGLHRDAGGSGIVKLTSAHFESNAGEYDVYAINTVYLVNCTGTRKIGFAYDSVCQLLGGSYSAQAGEYVITINGITLQDTYHQVRGARISGTYGININKARRNIIQGNYIYTSGGSAGYAVTEGGGSDYNIIEGNIADGNADFRYVSGPNTRCFAKQVDLFTDLLAEDTNYIVAAEDLTQATPITSIIANQPDRSRNLTLTITDTNASISAFSITVSGYDNRGNSITETLAFAGGLSQVLNNAFLTVTSVIVTSITGAGALDVLDIGIGSKLGLSHRIDRTADVLRVDKNGAYYAPANWTADATYSTVDVSTGGAIVLNDDFNVHYKTSLNCLT